MSQNVQDRDHGQRLDDARNLEKIFDTNGWRVYLKILHDEERKCVSRIETAHIDMLQCLQGALIQMRRVMRLPDQFIEDAAKRKEEKEEGEDNG